ncbi:LysM peptidoglycan-binding domain-containing protein [Microbacterium bovistercoris]|uniref:LysM peptidoglycan-binding domain-containing protein n=1 Tax=Microbacterium bovistercoris TaxID=2293570 RepID=A0A371NQC7_9MICO|nr:LysM peptidoglycan-binding domain-containing protein [Microbacterium bovistercoris]REJ04373.1 LysM peptidoglycan-binding domain-containing protein [Microbacterium bovistercoris]
MSTIGIAPTPIVGTRTRLRLTRRGRRVLSALVAAPIAFAIAYAGIAGGSALASGEHAAPVHFETVMVMPGDTLWSIAGEIAPAADPRDVIDEISSLNNLHGGVLQVGQELAVPQRYTD